ncbi:MAG: hypothetical protein QM808_14475 [Steroidobacteraceae bacterium]
MILSRHAGELIAVALMLIASSANAAKQVESNCDRWCLKAIADNYVAAMFKHDTKVVKVSPNVVVSENTRSIKFGEGVFATAKKFFSGENQTQYVMDTQQGEVGYMGILDAPGAAFYALRLKVMDGAITEIETLVTRREDGSPFWPEGYLYREAPYIRDVPKPVRSSRAGLRKAADTYWRVGGTTHQGSSVPYTQDCVHFQNGMNTDWERPLNSWEKDAYVQPSDGRIWTCAREVDLTTMKWTQTRGVHHLFDEERGLVMTWAFADTDPAKASKAPTNPDGSALPRPAWYYGPPGGPGPNGLSGPAAGAPTFNRRIEPFTMYHAVVMRVVKGRIQREQVFQRELDLPAQRPFTSDWQK